MGERLFRTKDDIYYSVPEGMDPNGPEAAALVAQERYGRTRRKYTSPEYLAKTKAEGEALAGDPTEDPERPLTGRTRANFGAGMMNIVQGLKQITPGIKSPTDEDVQEKRKLDRRLAASQDYGIGADWMPSTGKVTQVAGEVVPQLLAMRAVPLPASPVAQGAIMGGAGGALQPVTSDESRLFNTGVGAVLGAALPLAVKGIRAGYNYLTPARRAAQELSSELGPEAANIPGQVQARAAQRAGTTQAAQAIPETLAEATGNTTAGRIEAASAREMQPEWAAFKRAQNVARHQAVEKATEEATMGAQREAVRESVTDPMRSAALGVAGKSPWFHSPAQQAAQEMLHSSEAVNPSVRRVADYVLSSMDERAPTAITPEGLYNVRKVLVERLHGPTVMGDELGAAVKGADAQTMKLIAAIDQSLNEASGGRWGRYLSTYGRASRPVEASQAAQAVRDVFQKEGVREIGGVPEVTATRLGQALRASEGPAARRFPLTLSPPARQGVEDVLENVTRANEVQNVRKLAGTAGGGSQTSMDVSDLAHRALSPLGGLKVRAIRAALDWATKGGRGQTQRELVAMLQNPEEAVAAIQMAQRMNRPLTEAQRAVLNAIGTTGGTALPQAMRQQEQSYATR